MYKDPKTKHRFKYSHFPPQLLDVRKLDKWMAGSL